MNKHVTNLKIKKPQYLKKDLSPFPFTSILGKKPFFNYEKMFLKRVTYFEDF